jgi:hypothetical protein
MNVHASLSIGIVAGDVPGDGRGGGLGGLLKGHLAGDLGVSSNDGNWERAEEVSEVFEKSPKWPRITSKPTDGTQKPHGRLVAGLRCADTWEPACNKNGNENIRTHQL